ncbi:MAG: ABC transporter ATP-binding protein [Wenzhouxiangella sp.]|nr:MAG: ABC transporter ATP-binding protein [Wenzhouxiangella sp.]
MNEVLLRLQGVGKSYPPTVQSSKRLRAFWQILTRGHSEEGTSVLRDIEFQVCRGQSLGIIGANGAGKSTLLKVITGVLAPTSGTITRAGSQAALLELGAGFDSEYTGLENLRMNAAFLGLSRKEVDDKLDDILAFADIGKYIHEPVKHYSSGMVVRLGFAVVASVTPDLLITDEVLAVGDESFQKKCIRWIEGYVEQGGTLLMVSHNMYQVQKLCAHAIWLEGGRARAMGDVFDVTQRYLAWHERRDAEDVAARRNRPSGAICTVESVVLPDEQEGELRLEMGELLRVQVTVRSPDERAPVVLVGLIRADGTPVYGVASDHDQIELKPDQDGRVELEISFPELNLLPGGYAARAHTLDPEGLRIHDTREVTFTVTGRSRELGMVRLPHRWNVP